MTPAVTRQERQRLAAKFAQQQFIGRRAKGIWPVSLDSRFAKSEQDLACLLYTSRCV